MSVTITQEIFINDEDMIEVDLWCDYNIDHLEDNLNRYKTISFPVIEEITWDKEKYSEKINLEIENYIKKYRKPIEEIAVEKIQDERGAI